MKASPARLLRAATARVGSRFSRATIAGAPDPKKIRTSYVERQNLSLRMA